MMLRNSLLALAALSVAGCATDSAEDAGDRDCFAASSVRTYQVVDDRHVSVTVGANRHYIMTTMFDTSDLDWTHAIALRSRSSFICTGNSLDVELIGGDHLVRRYPVRTIERAPEEPPAEQ